MQFNIDLKYTLFRVIFTLARGIMKCVVNIAQSTSNDLEKVPFYIARKLEYWVNAVENYGIDAVRKIPGFHDEPLKGMRKGQRSIRLNKTYRAIYIETKTEEIQILLITEVNKHDY